MHLAVHPYSLNCGSKILYYFGSALNPQMQRHTDTKGRVYSINPLPISLYMLFCNLVSQTEQFCPTLCIYF